MGFLFPIQTHVGNLGFSSLKSGLILQGEKHNNKYQYAY
jgi:hypothetical protein